MEKVLWCFLVLINFPNAFGQTDMSENAFIFPKESDNSYVSLEAQLKKPLKAFTVCLQIYTELSMTHGYKESNTIYVGETFSPNVLKWRSLIYEAHGDVFTKPQLWP
ncbi:LOW QUALITY PROTEIN: C-reactive protein [Castor canadensis]|uniref:LOW QUALITY PROTEIN: C-reactive protein n=1 Tax=Castor canadensis TaxID=51338 RepID=A0AC58KJD9_CASCN